MNFAASAMLNCWCSISSPAFRNTESFHQQKQITELLTATCRERLVGQVMASSISINNIDHTDPDYPAIVQRMHQEIERAQQIYGKPRIQSSLPAPISADGRAIVEENAPPPMPDDPEAKARLIDHTVICSVMCCCREQPNAGVADQNLYDSCARGVFAEADRALAWKSRYKAQIAYDMRAPDGPAPFMHRDADGNDTTQSSHRWQSRLGEGYQRGQGHVRVPDLTIVLDPKKPPVKGNRKVREFKFMNDRRDREQDKAYIEIAGGQKNYLVHRVGGLLQDGEQGCNCDSPMELLVPLALPQPAPRDEQAPGPVQTTGAAVAWMAVTAVAAAAVVLAVLSPFEGPLGEAALGAATAGAAARSAAAWRAIAPIF